MMNSSPATMNDDVILEIMSRCHAKEIAKFRLLNKACNKRSYESCFINDHLRRTNSVFGYFIQYGKNRRSSFVSGGIEEGEAHGKTRISLKFLLSRDVKIEACDAHNGILLCVDDDKSKRNRRTPDYIVCKPATKQYRVIPNPKTRYFTIATGLMVIQSNPFRYKIVRVSEPLQRERRKTKEGFSNLNCEVFDSDSFSWKRLDDLELPSGEFFPRSGKLVSSYGSMHWLTTKNNVIRFCTRTETWSCFPVPDNVVGDGSSLDLISYEGKLGVICSNPRDGYDLWVLEKNLENSWVKVKDVRITDPEDEYARPLWFLGNDVVSVAGFGRLGLYNMNSSCLRMKTQQHCLPFYLPRDVCFPFYSNFERICLDPDRHEREAKATTTKYLLCKILCCVFLLFFSLILDNRFVI